MKKRKNCKNIWDNKLLYSSPIMLGELKPVKFNIDISNVLNLRIEIDGSAYAGEYVSTMLISIHNKNPLQNKLPVLNNGEFSMLPAYYNQ